MASFHHFGSVSGCAEEIVIGSNFALETLVFFFFLVYLGSIITSIAEGKQNINDFGFNIPFKYLLILQNLVLLIRKWCVV